VILDEALLERGSEVVDTHLVERRNALVKRPDTARIKRKRVDQGERAHAFRCPRITLERDHAAK
jgi:hypothetical protein